MGLWRVGVSGEFAEGRDSEIVIQGQGEWTKGDSEGKLIQAERKKLDGEWEAAHLWVFEAMDEKRRHARSVLVRNNK